MDQELKRRTLTTVAGGSMTNVALGCVVPALCDLTYITDDPLVVEMTISALVKHDDGDDHAEIATWLVGRDLFRQAFATSGLVGEGDIAIAFDRAFDQVVVVFTDGNPRNNPLGLRHTHRLQLDAEPVAAFIHHAYRLVPQPQVDVDGFIDQVLEAGR